ncbi:MAG TPA: glucuronate isomerase, partial [Candidatus Pygmaiobacter gallistercoris]|nr:glucuronate isomerase [Candidatus Pygmaiobacter gallistercoris]
QLYHNCAAQMPIIDYHCHIDPKQIYEDQRFENLTQLWLAGDHYKWRLMRSNGVEERYITGDASDWEKFEMFAKTLPLAIGNPMVHWCHLELKNYFGYEGFLNEDTAKEVWDLCAKKLKSDPDLTARGLIRRSNVKMIGTTNDPGETLEWHEKLKADPSFPTKVLPTFRPDVLLNIHRADFADQIHKLETVGGRPLTDLDSLRQAIIERMDYFDAHGCRSADHGLDEAVYREASETELEAIYAKALAGEKVTKAEQEAYQTALLLLCGAEYAKRGWVWQIHYSCLRNPNSRMFAKLGPDMGFDSMNEAPGASALARLLDTLDHEEKLPKTILYSLNPGENEMLDALIGAFQGPEIPGKIQHGSAWWFNDTESGMRAHLTSLANLSILGNFVGMLTDSRSLLSYARHEYFRRVLCDWIGNLVEQGEYPCDLPQLERIVRGVCYENAKRYFNL